MTPLLTLCGSAARLAGRALLLAALLSCSGPRPVAAAPPIRVLVNTSHGVSNVRGAVLDAGLQLATDVVVLASSADNGSGFVPPDRLADQARLLGATLLSSSFSGWQAAYDIMGYKKLVENGMTHVFAYVPKRPQPANAPPPAAFVTVNVLGGATGGGIEFGIPAGYLQGKGQSQSSSGVTAQLAGLMAALKYRHPAWNWFDVKAALRSTAANYSTGYDPRRYGYGSIDYPAANALPADPRQLPLFPPAVAVGPQTGDRLPFHVNPFRQSRRRAEALFKFASPPPVGRNELTLAEIRTLGGEPVAAGDMPITGNVYQYRVTRDETACFVWLTRDAAGRFSPIEPYAIIGPLVLTAGQQRLGPRLPPAP